MFGQLLWRGGLWLLVRLALFQQQQWRQRWRRPKARQLGLEALEARYVPTTTNPFFLDTDNRLYAAIDEGGQSFEFTGGYGVQLSVALHLGGFVAAIRDGNNRVYLYNAANEVFTDTGAYAIDITSGFGIDSVGSGGGTGRVYLRDGANRVHVLTLDDSLNPDRTFQVRVTQTDAWALQMDAGFDLGASSSLGLQTFLALRAGDNSVHALGLVGGAPVYGFSGAYAVDLVAGDQGETFIRDGDNRVHVLTIATLDAGGVTFQAPLATAAFALSGMSVGLIDQEDDLLAYRAGDNSLNLIRYSPGSPAAAVEYASVDGAFALQVDASALAVFTRGLDNRVVYYVLEAGDITSPARVETAAFAIDVRSTGFSTVGTDNSRLAILDGNRRLYVSQVEHGGEAPSFFDTGFLVNDVQGFPLF